MVKNLFHTIIVVALFLFVGLTTKAQEPTDSLLHAVRVLPKDTNKINQMNDLVWKLRFSNYSEAISLGNESFALSKQMGFVRGSAYATKNLGGVYFNASNYDSAQVYYKHSLMFFEELQDKKGIAIAYRNLGNVFFQKSVWTIALDYYLKSLELREELGDKLGVASVNGAIGLLYVSSHDKNTEKAIDYFRKSLKTYTELGDSVGMATTYLYIGNFYHDLTQKQNDSTSVFMTIDSALFYFYESKAITVQQKSPSAMHNLGTIYDAIGSVYMRKSMNDSALVNFEKSMEIRVLTGNKYGIAGTSYNIARFYATQENSIDSTKKYLIMALDTAKNIGANSIERDVSKELAGIYQKIGNYKEASNLYLRYIVLNDSLLNAQNTKRFTQLEMQYEFDREKKVADALHSSELQQQKRVRNIFIGGFGFVAFLALLIFKNYRDKKKANNLLEELNAEMREKNEMLNQQKEEIMAQRDEIEKNRDEIAESNRAITDSIVYAQRIQQAVMPPEEYFDKILKEYFIFFKPRDIVSGDYYWATHKDNKIIITAADCTGHGVPGAFMSLLGISFLNEIVNKINPDKGEEIKANLILNQLRATIKSSLRQTGKKFNEAKDGMDMALCVIDTVHKTLQFAGANNPALIVRNKEIIEIKADKMPVGVHYKEKESFTFNELDYQDGDTVYLFSDGYIDQFGGDKGRKFMIRQFKEIILEMEGTPLKEQKDALSKRFSLWLSADNTQHQHQIYTQIDDVLVLAFRL